MIISKFTGTYPDENPIAKIDFAAASPKKFTVSTSRRQVGFEERTTLSSMEIDISALEDQHIYLCLYDRSCEKFVDLTDGTGLLEDRIRFESLLGKGGRVLQILLYLVVDQGLPDGFMVVTDIYQVRQAIEGQQFIVPEVNSDVPVLSVTDYWKMFAPASADVVDAKVKKAQFLVNMSPHASLSYLEAQLDLLAEIVRVFLEDSPDFRNKIAKKFPELDAALAVMKETSVLNRLTVVESMEKLNSGKRVVQEKLAAFNAGR